MRKPLIAGNWKMHKTIDEAVQLAASIKRELLDYRDVDIVLCPPYTSLYSVYEVIRETNIKLAAQDLFWEREGAFTGEVSPLQIADCGADFVIIGHSERRKYFSESDEQVNRKIKAALQVPLKPIVCVGETLKEREAGSTKSVVKKQLKAGLDNLNGEDIQKITIAYEPVWAIGTGRTATPQTAEEVHKFIRSFVKDEFSSFAAESMRILYGGSVKPANTGELIAEQDIDGALVGGASLDCASFVEIVKNSLRQG